MTDTNPQAQFSPLRKKAWQLPEEQAWEILTSPEITYGFLGLHGLPGDGGLPYVVPMNFAAEAESRSIYFHTTLDTGSKRNRAIAADARAAFTVVAPDSEIVRSEDGIACKFTMNFTSVMAFGEIETVNEPAEKARILDLLMSQKSGAANVQKVPEHATAITAIYRLRAAHVCAARKQ